MIIPPYRLLQIILVLLLGVLWLNPLEYTVHTTSIAQLNETGEYTLTGTISDFQDIRRDKAQYQISAIRDEEGNQFTDKLLIKTWIYPEYKAFDVILFRCQPETPFELEDFSYKDYLSLFGIVTICNNPFIEKFGEQNNWKRTLFATKASFEESLNYSLPEPHSSLAAGLITGSRRGIPDYVMKTFNATGLTHIIAISGYNISLVILLVSYCLRPFSQTTRFIVSLCAIFVFVTFVGGQAAVVRAGIMGAINVLALKLRRPTNITNVVLLTAVIMAISNPRILSLDVGFKLSFSSTLGLIYISPLLEKWMKHIPDVLAIKESLLLTLSAQICATPIILHYFGRLSLVSIPANILAAPFIPLSMLFCGLVPLTVSLGFLGVFIRFISYCFLECILIIAKILAMIPYASIDLTLGTTEVVLYYLLLVAVLFLLRHKKYFTEFPLFGNLE